MSLGSRLVQTFLALWGEQQEKEPGTASVKGPVFGNRLSWGR